MSTANDLKVIADAARDALQKAEKEQLQKTQANICYAECLKAAQRGFYDLHYTGALNDGSINILVQKGFCVHEDDNGFMIYWNRLNDLVVATRRVSTTGSLQVDDLTLAPKVREKLNFS